jgi:thiol-disulfide isomerase/thioredoxin
MVNNKLRKTKKTKNYRRSQLTKRVKHRSSSVIDVRSPLDVKKALDIINKSKITLVLVYADWCPHCHTYKPFWEKLTKQKDNQVGMVAVEQANSQRVLENINDDSTGQPMNVNAFPQVIAVGKTPNGTNSGVTIENRNGEEIVSLVKNGSKVMNNTAAATAPTIATRTPTPYPSNELAEVHGPTMMNSNSSNSKKTKSKMSMSEVISRGSKNMLSNMGATPVNMGSMASKMATVNSQESANSSESNEIDEEEIEKTVNESGIFKMPTPETEVGKSSSKTPSIIGGGGCGCSGTKGRHRLQGGSLYESLVSFAGPVAPAAGLLAAQQTLFKSGRIGLLRSQKSRRMHLKKILSRSRRGHSHSHSTRRTKKTRRHHRR